MAEMEVQANGMLRNPEAMGGINIERKADVPMDTMTTPFYAKFMTPAKIHYSNSVSTSGIDVIHRNMKGVYSKTVFTELDVVDTEPAVTFIVENAVAGEEAGVSVKVEKDIVKRTKTAKAKRQLFYDRIAALYANNSDKRANSKVKAAPIDVVVEESVAEAAE